MRNEYYFRVAGLLFSVALPDGWDVETILPSFHPFRCKTCSEGETIFRVLATTQSFADDGKRTELLEDSPNDIGRTRLFRSTDGYCVEINNDTTQNGLVHTMITDPHFESATAYIRPEDSSMGAVLSSMVRFLFAQAVLKHDGVFVHASCVSMEGKSYLFLGKSGTGKSTHTRQWLQAFPDCRLLNDDNPALRIEDGKVMVYGTPWSGKTSCYKNEGYPVAGIARLRQAKTNSFYLLEGPEIFAALLPSCSAIRQDAGLLEALYCTLIQIAEQVTVGCMECLPNIDAARVCYNSLYARG